MLHRYQDLISPSPKKLLPKISSDDDTSIDTEASDHDFRRNFMGSYRKTTQQLILPSHNEFSFQTSTGTRYETPMKNSRIGNDLNNSVNLHFSPTMNSKKIEVNERNDIKPAINLPRRSTQKKKRKRLRDYLTFDHVFDKYLNGDYESDDYEYYSYDELNEPQSLDDDMIDSNDESETYPTTPVHYQAKKKNYQKAEILHPNVSVTSLNSLNVEKSARKSPF